jgi:cytochrome c peroxidase
MMYKNLWYAALVTSAVLLIAVFGLNNQGQAQNALTPLEELGQFLYFDTNLSEPNGQSCASCHEPSVGFDDPVDFLPVSEGVIPGLFGTRNSPASSYAMYSPTFYFDNEEELWIGGQFWDGRGTGYVLGDPLADQALGPFMNPVEMANIAKYQVVNDVATSAYRGLFQSVWGYTQKQMDRLAKARVDTPDVVLAYDRIALSIAAFERTQLFGQFSSKYDAYLAECLKIGGDMDDCAVGTGRAADRAAKKVFTQKERVGMKLFMGENNNDGIMEPGEGAMCSACHIADWTLAADYHPPVQSPLWAPEGWVPPIFSDFTYDNLGIPLNPEIADLIGEPQPLDYGLGAVLGDEEEYGKFKVMSLRNIGLTAPYGHNGYFKTLTEITDFYSSRDSGAWEPAEYELTVNHDELGNLGLSAKDIDALVAFMLTLSDGYQR